MNFLPGRPVRSASGQRANYFASKISTVLLTVALIYSSSFNAQAQSEPDIIKDWASLEEADFFFDVYYRVLRCDMASKPMIHLIAFNEGGNVDAVGFSLVIKDGTGKTANHEVPKFEIGFAKTFKASCDNDDYDYLKLEVPEGFDYRSIEIDITYNK